MTKPTLIIVLMFVLALGAGVVAGKLSARVSSPVVAPTEHPVGSLSELNLTGDQRTQMKRIWEQVRDTAHGCEREKEVLSQKHEADVVAMLSDAQKATYKQLNDEANAKSAKIEARRKAAFDDAVTKTMGILNEEQRLAYRQILQDRVGDTPVRSEIVPVARDAADTSASQPAR